MAVELAFLKFASEKKRKQVAEKRLRSGNCDCLSGSLCLLHSHIHREKRRCIIQLWAKRLAGASPAVLIAVQCCHANDLNIRETVTSHQLSAHVLLLDGAVVLLLFAFLCDDTHTQPTTELCMLAQTESMMWLMMIFAVPRCVSH